MQRQTDATATVVVDTQASPCTCEMAVQAYDNHQDLLLAPKPSLEGVEPLLQLQNAVPTARTDSNTQTDDTTNPTIITDPQHEFQGSRSSLLHDEMLESPPMGPVVIQKSPMLTVIPPPIHFDWAEDAELIPIVHKPP